MKIPTLLTLGSLLCTVALVLPLFEATACEDGCQEYDCYQSKFGTCIHYLSNQCAYLSAGDTGMHEGDECDAVSPAIDITVQVCTSCTQDCATANGFGQASGCSGCSGNSTVRQNECVVAE